MNNAAAEAADRVDAGTETAVQQQERGARARPRDDVQGDEATGYRTQWDAIQTGFVDEPRKAVEEADALVAQVIKRLSEVFADERTNLEQQSGPREPGVDRGPASVIAQVPFVLRAAVDDVMEGGPFRDCTPGTDSGMLCGDRRPAASGGTRHRTGDSFSGHRPGDRFIRRRQ